MKINISYYLEEYGWSSCWITVNNKTYEISITHVLSNDPIEECMNCLIQMAEGQTKSEFKWYGEPGGERITIKEIATEKHRVEVIVDTFTCVGDATDTYSETIRFSISKKLLATMFYYEFKKISELLKDKNYNKNRNSFFPFQLFKSFEKSMLEFIN